METSYSLNFFSLAHMFTLFTHEKSAEFYTKWSESSLYWNTGYDGKIAHKSVECFVPGTKQIYKSICKYYKIYHFKENISSVKMTFFL